MTITQELIDQHRERVRAHSKLVFENCLRLARTDKRFAKAAQSSVWHDVSKLSSPESEGYIYLSVMPKVDAKDLLKIIDKSILHHYRKNDHHPEFYDIESYKKKVAVNAKEMPEQAIVEMVADWFAVSQQKFGANSVAAHEDLIKWKEANVNKRWLFTDTQVSLIDYVIDLLKISV
jgi:hypothetical protein